MTITHILFDLDNTLYPGSAGIMQLFDERISDYVSTFLKLDPETAAEVRRNYYATYGTTLRGLQQNFEGTVDVEEYLHFVHAIEIDTMLSLNAELDQQLGEIKARKSIFTNSPLEHAERVLKALGIAHHFDHIFDIRFHEFDPKPSIAAYHRVLGALGITGSEVLFVEDTAQNLMPARQLGMTTILLSDDPQAAEQTDADYVVLDVLAAVAAIRELEVRQDAAADKQIDAE